MPGYGQLRGGVAERHRTLLADLAEMELRVLRTLGELLVLLANKARWGVDASVPTADRRRRKRASLRVGVKGWFARAQLMEKPTNCYVSPWPLHAQPRRIAPRSQRRVKQGVILLKVAIAKCTEFFGSSVILRSFLSVQEAFHELHTRRSRLGC